MFEDAHPVILPTIRAARRRANELEAINAGIRPVIYKLKEVKKQRDLH